MNFCDDSLHKAACESSVELILFKDVFQNRLYPELLSHTALIFLGF